MRHSSKDRQLRRFVRVAHRRQRRHHRAQHQLMVMMNRNDRRNQRTHRRLRRMMQRLTRRWPDDERLRSMLCQIESSCQ